MKIIGKQPEPQVVNYGQLREKENEKSINFICVPTDKEFEFMIAHGYEHNTSSVVKTFLSRNTIKG